MLLGRRGQGYASFPISSRVLISFGAVKLAGSFRSRDPPKKRAQKLDCSIDVGTDMEQVMDCESVRMECQGASLQCLDRAEDQHQS